MDDDYSNITYQICQLRLSISRIQHFVVATGPVVATVTLFYIKNIFFPGLHNHSISVLLVHITNKKTWAFCTKSKIRGLVVTGLPMIRYWGGKKIPPP